MHSFSRLPYALFAPLVLHPYWLLLVVLVVGCTHLTPTPAVGSRLHIAKLSQRRALGPIVDPLSDRADEAERLNRIAELALALDDSEEASQAALAAFHHVLAADTAARVFGASDAKLTRQRLIEQTSLCGRQARALEDPSLALACARGPVELERGVLRWALTQQELWVHESDKARLRGRFDGDREVELKLGVELSAKELRKLGRAGLEALNTRLMEGETEGLERSLAAAEVLLAEDPLHIPARILQHLRDDLVAGSLVRTASFMRDLLSLTG